MKKKREKKSDAFLSLSQCALSASTSNKFDWFIDSGASSHMTSNSDLLRNFIKKQTGEIVTANGVSVAVEGVGEVCLKIGGREINVKNVLYVPKINVNLLSVSKMVEKGNVIKFDKNNCIIKNGDGDVLVKCTQNNGVYRIQNSEKCFASIESDGDMVMWHRKLGHMNCQTLTKMQKIVKGMNFGKNPDVTAVKNCQVCAEGKQHVLPFTKSTTSTTSVLQLIHSDVVGPMETRSIGKARYILTFVDDFSRMVWVYFFERKVRSSKPNHCTCEVCRETNR